MGRIALLAVLVVSSGCFSWTQAEPPARARWNDPVQHRCDGPGVAVVPLGFAALLGGGSIAIFATTEDGGLADIEERSWAAIMLPFAIGYAIDGLNALGDGRECTRYREYLDQPRRFAARSGQ